MPIEHNRINITAEIISLKYIIDLIFLLNWECFNLVINRYTYLKLQRQSPEEKAKQEMKFIKRIYYFKGTTVIIKTAWK